MIFGPFDGDSEQDAVDEVERKNQHCYVVRDKVVTRDGGGPPLEIEGFLCGRLGPPCELCGDVSEVLCDFPLGDEGRTCDKPLCTRCAPTIGEDKNYCPDHPDAHNLLLFRRPLHRGELARAAFEDADHMQRVIIGQGPRKKPRLPKAPPPSYRWRVICPPNTPLGPHATQQWIEKGRPLLDRWLDEREAHTMAFRLKGRVQTWDEFVAWHRKQYPLAKRRKQKPPK